mgnify:FL=1
MENNEFIESGLIFNLNSKVALRKFKYSSSDFAKHGKPFKWVNDYVDQNGEFPPHSLLQENFPELNPEAADNNLDYLIQVFKNQVTFRGAVRAFQNNKELLQENPKKAISQISSLLDDVIIHGDEDIVEYDKGSDERFKSWIKRKEERENTKDGLRGIKTPFSVLNNMGVGWLPGELIAFYARPTIGKTWMCVDIAATAVKEGVKTLLVSTEMPVEAISLRLDVVLAQKMGYEFSHTSLRTGREIDEDKYKEFLEKSNGKKLLICDHIEGESSISLEGIATLIRKYNPELVVLDGVYLVTTKSGSNRQMWEQSHSLFYGLKNLSLSFNIPIVVSTQATREASDTSEFPTPTAVAFGDALIRAADVVIAMRKPETDKSEISLETYDNRKIYRLIDRQRDIKFQKYRDGDLPVYQFSLKWDVDKGLIREYNIDERDY